MFGGRDDPASIAKIAPNGIMLTEALDPTFEAWASFGKHYLDSAAPQAVSVPPEQRRERRLERVREGPGQAA